MSGWLVGRARTEDLVRRREDGTLDTSLMDEIADWIRSLGVDPTEIVPRVVVTYDDGQYRLHLSEYVLDDNGCKQLDLAADVAYRRPVVVPVEPDSWPAWLTGLNRTE